MGDRRPFRFLATAVSGQSNQRRQDRWERSPADEESGQYLSQDGGQHATEKQHLSGSAVPPIQNQARVSHRDQGHGGQAGPIGVPHAAPRDEIRGPRSEVLRDPTPQPTDQTAQVESCQAGISSPPSSCSLRRGSFWGENAFSRVTTLGDSRGNPNLSALSGVAYGKLGAICSSLIALTLGRRHSRSSQLSTNLA